MPKEHPGPTLSTIKKLYFLSRICAKPGCNKPHYEQDSSFNWILKSRICHIHARREGGERWSGAQTAAENRSKDNLLILCIEHAYEIDEPGAGQIYTADTLTSWKRDQEASSDDGFRLSDREAETVRTSMVFSPSNSVFNLGGQGGRAPGAGGGGGGAIGNESRGGDGGKGGDIESIDVRVGELPDRVRYQLAEWLPNLEVGDEGRFPGAGGGGEGASGDGAMAGHGGDGGRIGVGRMYIPESPDGSPLIMRVTVGQGGELPGEHGGKTLLNFVTRNGQDMGSFELSGGRARSGASRLPAGAVGIGYNDIDEGFRLEGLLLAGSCKVENGALTVSNAGWDYLPVKEFPTKVLVTWVCFLLPPKQPGGNGFYISLLDSERDEISCRAVTFPSDAKQKRQFIYGEIGAKCESSETWHLCAYFEDNTKSPPRKIVLSDVPFHIRGPQ